VNERDAKAVAEAFRVSGGDVTARPRPIGANPGTEGTASVRWELAGKSAPPGGLCIAFTTADMHLLINCAMVARIK
jgi:hypothetical protein